MEVLEDTASRLPFKMSSSAAMASEAVLEIVGLVGDWSRRSGSLGVVEARKASRVAEDSKEVTRSGASRVCQSGLTTSHAHKAPVAMARL